MRQGLRVIVIDDLHFADAASLELIGDLITRSRAEPCCAWLLSMRPHEGDAALPALVQQIESLSSTQRLELASLDVAAVQALVDAMALPGLGGSVHAEQLHRLTGGTPLFLLETLKALPDGPPAPGAALEWPRARGVLRLIQQRLMRLSPQALRVMRCAAVAGAELQAQRVARMLGLRPIDLADAWSELEAAQVLRGDAFTHDLVAEAAAATVPAAVAAPLHAELAQVLEDEGSIDAARVASHWQAAGLPLRAAPHLRLAARRACGQVRLREAGQMARQAAQACDGAGLRDEAFDAWFDAAFALSEAEQVEAVIDCADALDRLAASDEQRAAAACARIYVLIEQQQLPLALQLATQALPLAQQARAADLEVELLWSRAVLHWDMRQGALSLDLIETALERADTADLSRARLPVARTVAKLMHAGAVVALSLGLGDKAQRLFERSLREGQQQGSLQVPAGCMAALAKLALDQGDLARSRHWKSELEQVWSRMGADEQEARFVERVDLMPVLRALGAHGEALALADAVMERVGRQIDRAQNRALIEACLSYHELGRADLALRGLRDLSGRDDLLDVDQLRLAAALAQVRGLPLPPEVLIRVAELDDVGLRARLLCLAHRACDPHQILPMLSLAAGQAQDQANPGRWLALQACRLSVLRRSGRDARALALDLWARLQDGLASPEAYPNVATSVCAALADCETERALTLAMQTRSWMLNAATGLPTIWRESYLTRAPLLQLLGPRERAVVLGLPGATGPTALPQ